jgi:hypothetical protein
MRAKATKATLILTLIAGLFYSTLAAPVTAPSDAPRGACAKMQCTMGCCANKACCAAMEQRRAPEPAHATPRPDLQVAAARLTYFAPLYFAPPASPSIALRDDGHGRPTPPLLAVICVRLI